MIIAIFENREKLENGDYYYCECPNQKAQKKIDKYIMEAEGAFEFLAEDYLD